MIWFKLSLEEKSLDDSQELTEMVREREIANALELIVGS